MKKLITTTLAALAFSAAAQPIPANVPVGHHHTLRVMLSLPSMSVTFQENEWGVTSLVAGTEKYAMQLSDSGQRQVVTATMWFPHSMTVADASAAIISYVGVTERDCRKGGGRAMFAFAPGTGMPTDVRQIHWTSTMRFYTEVCRGAFANGLFTR